MKVYFLPSYIERAPSSRMRVYKIAEYFREQKQDVQVIPFDLSVEDKHAALKHIQPEDILYVQKWRGNFNNPEHVGMYKGKCKVIFDADDETRDKAAEGLAELCDAFSVGNHFLLDKYNDGKRLVFLTPSAVDLSEYPKFVREGAKPMICLAKCGIRPILRSLEGLKDVLCNLQAEHKFQLVLAGFDGNDDKHHIQQVFPFARCYQLLTYNDYLRNMVPLLQMSALGILPFQKKDNGKSGHSALANLAMGIPTVAAPYAECEHIIEDGVNGFLADNFQEWYTKVEALLEDEKLRQRFREAGWRTIIDRYDVPVIGIKLLEDLRSL